MLISLGGRGGSPPRRPSGATAPSKGGPEPAPHRTPLEQRRLPGSGGPRRPRSKPRLPVQGRRHGADDEAGPQPGGADRRATGPPGSPRSASRASAGTGSHPVGRAGLNAIQTNTASARSRDGSGHRTPPSAKAARRTRRTATRPQPTPQRARTPAQRRPSDRRRQAAPRKGRRPTTTEGRDRAHGQPPRPGRERAGERRPTTTTAAPQSPATTNHAPEKHPPRTPPSCGGEAPA